MRSGKGKNARSPIDLHFFPNGRKRLSVAWASARAAENLLQAESLKIETDNPFGDSSDVWPNRQKKMVACFEWHPVFS